MPQTSATDLRVLHVTGELAPNHEGGIGVMVDDLARSQAKAGVDVRVAVTKPRRKRNPWRSEYEVSTLPAGRRIFGNPISLGTRSHLWRLAQDTHVVHAHSQLFHSTLVAARLRRRAPWAFVVTVHGLTSQTAPSWVSRLWLNTGAAWILRQADAVICLKELDRRTVASLGVPTERLHLIPNQVDAAVFSRGPATRSATILFVGRLVRGKGVATLLRSLTRLRPRPGLRCVVIGQGPELKRLQALARTASCPVVFLSHVTMEDLVKAYQTAGCFVLPSVSEGLPLTLLEALSCGTPVIADESLADVVGNQGLTVPFGDASALADAIDKVLDGGPAAFGRANPRDVTDLAQAHIRLYEGLRGRP